MNFPNRFDRLTTPLREAELPGDAKQDLMRIAEAGFEVHYGLTESLAGDISRMCLEPAIKEYCPNDYGKRFKDLEATTEWLSKSRGTFLLVKKTENANPALIGYGWAGAGSSPHVPGGETTFAIRIGEAGQGQGLATPFARLIVYGAAVVYGAKNFWLETWQSNGGAVHVYHKIGFVDVDQEADQRVKADGTKVADTRLYMSLPNELLP